MADLRAAELGRPWRIGALSDPAPPLRPACFGGGVPTRGRSEQRSGPGRHSVGRGGATSQAAAGSSLGSGPRQDLLGPPRARPAPQLHSHLPRRPPPALRPTRPLPRLRHPRPRRRRPPQGCAGGPPGAGQRRGEGGGRASARRWQARGQGAASGRGRRAGPARRGAVGSERAAVAGLRAREPARHAWRPAATLDRTWRST